MPEETTHPTPSPASPASSTPELSAELERVKRELEQTRAAHARESRLRAIREAVTDSLDKDVASLLIDRSLAAPGVPASGAELPEAVKRAAEQLRREKPYLFEPKAPAAPSSPARGVIAAPASDRGRDTDQELRSAADSARSSGDRRALIQYLSLRARREQP
jgi:hypothetical protein